MVDWREGLCGTVVLRPALKEDNSPVSIQALQQLSERMSCGGMHVPHWQQKRLDPQPTEAADKSLRFLHLTGQEKEKPSILMVAQAHPDRRTPVPSDIPTPSLDTPSANTSAMLREIDNLWHKN